jgi:hypothetical protein
LFRWQLTDIPGLICFNCFHLDAHCIPQALLGHSLAYRPLFFGCNKTQPTVIEIMQLVESSKSVTIRYRIGTPSESTDAPAGGDAHWIVGVYGGV